MKLRKILAGFLAGAVAVTSMVVTSVTASAAADPVLPDVEYGEVKYEKTGEHTFALKTDGSGSVETSLIQLATSACGGTYTFEEDDVVVLSVTTDAADISNWNAAVNGFTTSWGGWQAVASDAGVLTVSGTIKEIMTANSITDIAELGGIIYQVWNAPEGATVKYSLVLAEAAASEGEGDGDQTYDDIADPVLPDVEYGEVKYEKTGEHTFALKTDGSGAVETSLVQLATSACGGTYTFEEDDVVVLSITTNASDISNWNAAVNGFTTGWGGWQAVASDAGVLTVSGTIKEIMTANSITDIAELGGIIYQVWNAPEGATVKYSLVLAEAAAEEEPTPDTPAEEEGFDQTKADVEAAAENGTVLMQTATFGDVEAVRFTKVVSLEEIKKAAKVVFTFETNDGRTGTYESTNYYTSLMASGAKVDAPENYGFLSLTVTDIPDDVTLTCTKIELHTAN